MFRTAGLFKDGGNARVHALDRAAFCPCDTRSRCARLRCLVHVAVWGSCEQGDMTIDADAYSSGSCFTSALELLDEECRVAVSVVAQEANVGAILLSPVVAERVQE